MNRYRLLHVTSFDYDGPVTESYNEVRLRPLEDNLQNCLSFRLTTEPASKPSLHHDFFGNWVYQFNVLGEHVELRIEAESIVLVQEPLPLVNTGSSLEEVQGMHEELMEDFYDLLVPTSYVPHPPSLNWLVEGAERESQGSALGYAEALTRQIHTHFRYEKGATHVQSSVLDAIGRGAGVCQDFAHILIAAARIKGLPARYVSGYLVPRKTAEPGASVEEVIGGQASHAWAEVYVPGLDWVPFDPTLGQPVGVQHVRVAYGRDYGDVAPVRGVYKGHAGQRLSVDVRVRPALDDEGCENFQETTAGPVIAPAELEPPPQQQQQQQ